MLQLFCGLYIPVGIMVSGWQWFYYLCGTAQSLRFLALPQLACSTTGPCDSVTGQGGSVSTDVVALYLFNVYPDIAWQSYGWLWVIIAVFYSLSLLSYRFLNWTKR